MRATDHPASSEGQALPRPRPKEDRHGWPGRAAVAVTRGDPPQVFLAESDAVLARLVALRLVARTASSSFAVDSDLREIRDALLSDRWGDAVALWMAAPGEFVDAYPDEEIWAAEMLDDERASLEIRLAPIFVDE